MVEPGGHADLSPQVGGSDTEDPTRALRHTLSGIATVVAPASLVTALLYYFGWSRSNAQAGVMGLDDSLFGFSTRDYLLQSIDAMYWPLFIGALAALAALAGHVAIVTWAGEGPVTQRARRLLLWGTIVLVAIGTASLFLGAFGVQMTNPGRRVSLYSPVCLTVGIVLLGYSLHLHRRFIRPPSARPPTQELTALRLMSGSLIVLLLLLSLFWNVSRYAQIKGIDLAVALERHIPSRPDVTVYSAKRLHLQPPVREASLPAENSAYLFRYSGLKLLFRAEKTFYLRPSDPEGAGINVVIAESPDIRVEFVAAPS